MAPGAVALEVGIGSWNLDRDAEQREDTFLLGDALLRYGVAEHAEVQLRWTSLGFARTRNRISGDIAHRTRTGDVTLALRRNLANPDGSKVSVAVMPFVSLPVGGRPIGSGDWAAGAQLPLSVELSRVVSLSATSGIEAAVDEDGDGRHIAFDQVVGASIEVTDGLSATAEYEVLADHDPQGHHVEHLSGLSLAWQPQDGFQLDLGANLGLDSDAQDAEIYFGVARRF